MVATKKELMLAGMVLLTIPLFAEIALRVTHVPFEPQLYQPDRDRGWTLRPKAEGVVAVETKQQIRINELGFRDKERQYEKPENVLRIAVLGNSWTEALQVPIEKTYSAVLEQLLNERGCFRGKRVEVLNFGVAGYSTAQELLLFEQEAWKYRPDIVIVAFYSARDVSNNIRELNNTANPAQSPYFVYDGEKLVLDESFRALPALQESEIELEAWKVAVAGHVRLLQAINAMQRFGKTQVALAAVQEKAEQSGIDNLEYGIYTAPTGPEMVAAWHVTEGIFHRLLDAARAHNAQLRIVTLANRPQVLPDLAKREELLRKLGVRDLDYADRRIREFGAREGIAVTNLAPALSAYAQQHHAYLNGFTARNLGMGHWNDTGHRLAAEVIADDLCRGVRTSVVTQGGAQ